MSCHPNPIIWVLTVLQTLGCPSIKYWIDLSKVTLEKIKIKSPLKTNFISWDDPKARPSMPNPLRPVQARRPPWHGSRGGAGPVHLVAEDSVLFPNPASPPDVLGSSSVSGSCHSQPPLIPARSECCLGPCAPVTGRGCSSEPRRSDGVSFLQHSRGLGAWVITCALCVPGNSHPPLNSWLSLCLFSRDVADVGTTVPQLV